MDQIPEVKLLLYCSVKPHHQYEEGLRAFHIYLMQPILHPPQQCSSFSHEPRWFNGCDVPSNNHFTFLLITRPVTTMYF